MTLKLIDEKDFTHRARSISSTTSSTAPRAPSAAARVFANADGMFTPGMFGRIRVPGSPPYTALLVPDAAIGTEQARKYVLVVDDGNVVRQKYVTLGQLDDGLRVVKDGLAADRPRHRQRPDARAAGPEGERAGARLRGAAAAPRRATKTGEAAG